MKTKKQKKQANNRMLMSELINLKIYKTKTNKKRLNTNVLPTTNVFLLKTASSNFKRMLRIIFQYHFNRKKIIILGENLLMTSHKSTLIHKITNHIFVPKEVWINGLLSNKKRLKKFLRKKNPLLKLIKKPRLIVFYSYDNLLDSERYKQRITDVVLTNGLRRSSYLQKNPSFIFFTGNLDILKKTKLYNSFSALLKKIFKIRKKKRSSFLKLPKYTKKEFFRKRKIFFKKKKKSRKSYILKS